MTFVQIIITSKTENYFVKISKFLCDVKLCNDDVFNMSIKLSSANHACRFCFELCNHLHNIGVSGFNNKFEITNLDILFRVLMSKLQKFGVIDDDIKQVASPDLEVFLQKYTWSNLQKKRKHSVVNYDDELGELVIKPTVQPFKRGCV